MRIFEILEATIFHPCPNKPDKDWVASKVCWDEAKFFWGTGPEVDYIRFIIPKCSYCGQRHEFEDMLVGDSKIDGKVWETDEELG